MLVRTLSLSLALAAAGFALASQTQKAEAQDVVAATADVRYDYEPDYVAVDRDYVDVDVDPGQVDVRRLRLMPGRRPPMTTIASGNAGPSAE